MDHAIKVRLQKIAGSVVRALWIAEQRGFQLIRMHLEPAADGQLLHLVVAAGVHPIEVLREELAKLSDVMDVAVGDVG